MKRAKQARSRETQRNLIKAAEELIRESGAEGLKLDVLTSKAGCSIGSFYNLFSDRNAIVSAVMSAFKDRIIEEIRVLLDPERCASMSREIIWETIVDFSIEVYSSNDSLFRVSQSYYNEIPELVENGNEIVSEAVESLLKLPCIKGMDQQEIEFVIRINIATCDHYLFWRKPENSDPDTLRVHLLKLLSGAYPSSKA